jgi:hypothetical protein
MYSGGNRLFAGDREAESRYFEAPAGPQNFELRATASGTADPLAKKAGQPLHVVFLYNEPTKLPVATPPPVPPVA